REASKRSVQRTAANEVTGRIIFSVDVAKNNGAHDEGQADTELRERDGKAVTAERTESQARADEPAITRNECCGQNAHEADRKPDSGEMAGILAGKGGSERRASRDHRD